MDLIGFHWISLDFIFYQPKLELKKNQNEKKMKKWKNWQTKDFFFKLKNKKNAMDFSGFQWISLDFSGFQWISLNFIGFHWISLDFIFYLHRNSQDLRNLPSTFENDMMFQIESFYGRYYFKSLWLECIFSNFLKIETPSTVRK